MLCITQHAVVDDGLSKAWKNGVHSHWELESGEFWDEEIPFAIRRLIDPLGTYDFRLHHYDASQFGYRRPPAVEVSDHEEEDDEANNRNHDRNENRNTTVGHCIQVQLGQIQSGTAVSELNLFQF